MTRFWIFIPATVFSTALLADVVAAGERTRTAPPSDQYSEQDKFNLQRSLDQKSQFETMMSNTMKENSDTQSGIAGNLKDSRPPRHR